MRKEILNPRTIGGGDGADAAAGGGDGADAAAGGAVDQLIAVDENDEALGPVAKDHCHRSAILHRAFSIFIFNSRAELLLQQRSALKPLWPLFWSNSCCSHPRFGESMEDATQRRLQEELGITAELTYLFKFQYHATYRDRGAEHELCHVLVGCSDAKIAAHEEEIAAWRHVSITDVESWVAARPQEFTPWFTREWQRIRSDYYNRIPAG